MAEDNDATHLLAEDHREVEDLFEKFENASGKERKEKIARTICTELKIHSLIEEEIFYPALRGKVSDEDLDEAYVEHDGAKVLINEIEAGGPDEDFYDSKVKVLKEQIEHHVEEEEKQRGNLFQQARAADIDLDELGRKMKARKQELKAQAESGGLGPARPRTMETQ
ncbi:MAG: hemerythrin domain-containing protein [Sphingomonadaceae bacterium]